MKAVARFSLAALALGLVAAPASAQLAGLPVAYVPAGTGVTIGGTFGLGVNSDAENASGDKTMSAGGMVVLGLPTFWVGAGASYFDLSGDLAQKDVSFGGHAGYKLPLPPTTPVTLAIVAGASYLSADAGNVLFVPAGVTLGINVPSTGVAVTPWVSPQFRYTRLSPDVGDSESESSFGVAGGLAVDLPVGFGFDLSVDWNRIPADAFGNVGAESANPILIGAGIHYKIQVPGLGGM